MSPFQRKTLYAVTFEADGILLGGLVLHVMSDAPARDALSLSTFGAAVALAWNYAFNTMFEAWERRQTTKGRSFLRRAAHAALFELGLSVILVPATAWFLSATLLAAFLYEFGLIGFFLVYAWAFTWAFDHLFGLPDSAR